MRYKFKITLLTGFLFTLILAGCMPGTMSFSPQQAALRALTGSHTPNVVINQNSIQIRQSLQVDRKTYVVISHSQMDGAMQSKCLTVYETEQTSIGAWVTRSGGGGCSGTIAGTEPASEVPMEIGGGQSGGMEPGDPGHSHVAGLVNQTDADQSKAITRVRVTWADGQQQEVDVINGCYLAVRAGKVGFQTVEGLTAAGEAVYSNSPMVAPGKE